MLSRFNLIMCSLLMFNPLGVIEAQTTPFVAEKLPIAQAVSAKVNDFAATLTWKLPSKHSYQSVLIYRKAYALPIKRKKTSKVDIELGKLIAELDIKQQRFGDADLNPQVRYYYRVILVNKEGEKSQASIPAIAMLKDSEAPLGVEQIRAKVIDDIQFTLSWSASPSNDVQSYRILRARHKERPMMIKSVVVTDTSSSLYHTQIKQVKNVGLSYDYAIAAVDAAGNVSPVSHYVSIRLADNTAPANPLLLKAKQKGATIALSWRENTEDDLKGYHIYRRLNKTNASFRRLNKDLIKDSFFMDEKIASLQNYRYRVTAVDLFANESAVTKGLLVRSAYIKQVISAPSKIRLKANKKGFPELTWVKPKHAKLKANVYRSDGGAFKMLSSLLSEDVYIDDSINLSKAYRYQVKFISSMGELSPSSTTVLWIGDKQ